MWRRCREKKRTDGHDIPGPLGAASGPSSNPSSRKTGHFRGWRGWVLRLSLCVLSPILCFGLLEGGLRLGGYGYPTGFFLGPDANGVCTTNYRFGWRFFPRPLARDPHPCTLSLKPAGAVRIFVLGGSAAMGTPDPAFSFGKVLAVMLREQYPGVQFEVVNGAMTAINSHVALEIARDCAARQPDLFVVYMGNNEVIGPYGPGTVFQQWSPSRSMIRTSLWVKSTRSRGVARRRRRLLPRRSRPRGPLARSGDVHEQPGSGRRPSTGGRLRQLPSQPDRDLRHRPPLARRCRAFDRGREPARLSAAGLAAPPRSGCRGAGEMGVALQGGRRVGSEQALARCAGASTRPRRRSTTASRNFSSISPNAL